MKNRLTCFCICLFLFICKNSAQSISGFVLDYTGEKVEFISVLLLKAKDSSFVKGAVTDAQGRYEMKNLLGDTYFVSVSGVGYTKTNSAVFKYKLDNHTVETITLKNAHTYLDAVTITASKPLIEVQADKLIVNV